MEADKKRAEAERLYGEKGDIAWGNQIRSYVFQPYQMVKDLRTGVQTSDVQGVMDGAINAFIDGKLRGLTYKKGADE
jgi:peptide chain release factor 2